MFRAIRNLFSRRTSSGQQVIAEFEARMAAFDAALEIESQVLGELIARKDELGPEEFSDQLEAQLNKMDQLPRQFL